MTNIIYQAINKSHINTNVFKTMRDLGFNKSRAKIYQVHQNKYDINMDIMDINNANFLR